MTPDKQVKRRKPNVLKYSFASCWVCYPEDIRLFGWRISLPQAKRLHKWLGRTIAYLEHQDKKDKG